MRRLVVEDGRSERSGTGGEDGWTADVVQAGDVVGAAQLPMSCRGFSQSNTIPTPAI